MAQHDDPYGEDPLDDLADALGSADQSKSAASSYRSARAGNPSYCNNCGESLAGLHIGEPCPNCGERVGSGSSGGGGKTNGFAITSMVLGICSIPVCLCYGIFSIMIGITGVVFASLANKQIKRGGYASASKGMALAGQICSWVGIALGLLYIVFFIVIIILAETSP